MIHAMRVIHKTGDTHNGHNMHSAGDARNACYANDAQNSRGVRYT